MDSRIRHIIIAFFAGALAHKVLVYAYETWTSRPLAPGGEVLILPLMILLIILGWEIRGLFTEVKKESS